MRVFQPTLPARGATRSRPQQSQAGGISTHAPRTGSDIRLAISQWLAENFNPRSPHGERHARDAVARLDDDISTHAPRTGSDMPRP